MDMLIAEYRPQIAPERFKEVRYCSIEKCGGRLNSYTQPYTRTYAHRARQVLLCGLCETKRRSSGLDAFEFVKKMNSAV